MIANTKNIGKVDCILLGEYVLQKWGGMSHLKLQKILFYIQAYHLAVFDEPVFDDDFEAWLHGPVIRRLFNTVRDISLLYSEIRYVQEGSEELPDVILGRSLTLDQLNVIDEVANQLAKVKDTQLEAMTHSEDPWRNARKGVPEGEKCSNIIPKEEIHSFYQKQYLG